MDEGRLEQVKEDLRSLKDGDYYDTHDFAIALGESVNLADELVEEVERLSAFENRVKTRLAEQRTMLEQVQHDLDAAWKTGREMMARNLSAHRDYLEIEIKVMRKLLEEG